MAELGARLRRGRPLLLFTCLFAPFLGQSGAGPAARAPYAGKASRSGPVWVRVCRSGRGGWQAGASAGSWEGGGGGDGRTHTVSWEL